jgi:hypothetical protein
MSDKKLTFEYDLDGKNLVVTSIRATARIGITRYQMMAKANEANKTEPDEALQVLRLITYPDCISSSMVMRDGEAWKPTFDEFIDLDEELVNKWIEQVYTVNPQWVFKSDGGGADQSKKSSEPVNTSSD